MKKKIAGILGIVGISCVALGLGLGLGLSANHEEGSESCKETRYGKCYKNGAVTTDDERCATVGANILKKGSLIIYYESLFMTHLKSTKKVDRRWMQQYQLLSVRVW